MTALIVFDLPRGEKSIASGFPSGWHRYTPDHTDSQRGAQQATCRRNSDSPKSTARKSETSATAKGSTRKRHAGLIQKFTGISDLYEFPTDADVVIDPTGKGAEEGPERVFACLKREGFVSIGQNSGAPSRK